jgi:hypothetical protein
MQAEADRIADEEAARRADEAAAAAALLAEFAASSTPEVPEAAETEPGFDLEPEDLADADVRERVAAGGWGEGDNTDTAALLRELSSLGHEERDAPPPSGPAGPSRPRPSATPDKKTKKKMGLFGR